MNWLDENARRVREIQDSLIAIAQLARDHQLPQEEEDLLTSPYREMLNAVYLRDQPLAKLADNSDLLLHVVGPAAKGPTPKISVVTTLMSRTRDQVTRLAKLHGNVITAPGTRPRLPAALDMGLVGIAEGSLFIGFATLDAGPDGEAAGKAVDSITRMSPLVTGDASANDLDVSFPDPAERDVAIAAIHHLSPSGQLGIDEIDVFSRRGSEPTSWTIDTRRHARSFLSRPTKKQRVHSQFIGTVRELDLDANRFELRNLEGFDFIVRCAHELDDEEAKALMDRRVRVTGGAELDTSKNVRLLWIDAVELLG